MLFRTKERNKNSNSFFNEKFPNVGIELKDPEHLLQLEIIGLTEEDLQVARALKPHIEARVQGNCRSVL